MNCELIETTNGVVIIIKLKPKDDEESKQLVEKLRKKTDNLRKIKGPEDELSFFVPMR